MAQLAPPLPALVTTSRARLLLLRPQKSSLIRLAARVSESSDGGCAATPWGADRMMQVQNDVLRATLTQSPIRHNAIHQMLVFHLFHLGTPVSRHNPRLATLERAVHRLILTAFTSRGCATFKAPLSPERLLEAFQKSPAHSCLHRATCSNSPSMRTDSDMTRTASLPGPERVKPRNSCLEHGMV